MILTTLGLISIQTFTLGHWAKNCKHESFVGHIVTERSTKSKSHVGDSKPYYSRNWCFQLSPMAHKFGEAFWKPHWKVLQKGLKMHMMSHPKVWSSTTYQKHLVEFGEIPTNSIEWHSAVASMYRDKTQLQCPFQRRTWNSLILNSCKVMETYL